MQQTILSIVNTINLSVADKPSVLIGGASLMLYGSTRVTNDVDLLVSKRHFDDFAVAKKSLLKGQDERIDHVDILSALFEHLDFESVQPFVVKLAGVHVLELDVLLGTKILSYHHRPDSDSPKGVVKRDADITDVNWISVEMKRRNLVVREQVRDVFVCGPYNMLLVVDRLFTTFGLESLKNFEAVGGRLFECEWGDESFSEQAEIYEEEIAEGYEEDDLRILQSRRKPNFD